MKFKFKIQDYQTEAVKSVVDVFNGQPKIDISNSSYLVDRGLKNEPYQIDYLYDQLNTGDYIGYRNNTLCLDDAKLLSNIKKIQEENNIKLSQKLERIQGVPALDVEMETGTGKTYVYIKTIFELNKLYGWTKFIIIVPSIAIREGVKKTFEMTGEHFYKDYKKKARFFIYNSSNLNELQHFSSSSSIEVMIINMQAFNRSFDESKKNTTVPIIYSKRDNFASRRPIDVIAANNPIIIQDEPQKLSGTSTKKALKNFNPLFVLNYSATHKEVHNMVYVLDALDSYNKKLVKKIEVKTFQLKNFRGTDSYLYLDEIIADSNKPPRARIELEIAYGKSINRETRIVCVGDNLFYLSKEMGQYDGFIVSDIDGTKNTVTFTNGEEIRTGEVVGDISEKDMKRIQIRETILSHLKKEEKLFTNDIKCLSLFFIDSVDRYRLYDEENNPILGEYGKIFEEEYRALLKELNENNEGISDKYLKYLNNIDVTKTHNGYFSIDKDGRSIDSKDSKGGSEKDISGYDLILKNKERLLSFEEPTRFIFSHSALREGWDNPNVFQICTLKHSNSTTNKRQEVGRGMRIAVNKNGERMDSDFVGEHMVHDINMLTVVASDSYKNFVSALQKDIKEVLYHRPTIVTEEYFKGKMIRVGEEKRKLTDTESRAIYRYLVRNDYINDDERIDKKYREDLSNNKLAALPEVLEPISDQVHILVQGIYDDSILDDMISNANETKLNKNELNDNFHKKEFEELWKLINHKYAYRVDFDSEELIHNSIKSINEKLQVTSLQYTVSVGRQKDNLVHEDEDINDMFKKTSTKTETLSSSSFSNVAYDLIGKIAENTTLTRKTIARILKDIDKEKIDLFKENPEEFLRKVSNIINIEKGSVIVEHISYNATEDTFDNEIFTLENRNQPINKAIKTQKSIQDYVFTDGINEKDNVETRFVKDIEASEEVVVYAKLPKGFYIPTPVGNYSPDWAIAFKDENIKHIYFVAETKGSLNSLDLKGKESIKIECARKLFNNLSTNNLHYEHIDTFESLMNILKK